jgi:hypothetical protein
MPPSFAVSQCSQTIEMPKYWTLSKLRCTVIIFNEAVEWVSPVTYEFNDEFSFCLVEVVVEFDGLASNVVVSKSSDDDIEPMECAKS